MKTTSWFTDWFNTSYYHILYSNRDDSDAQLFMKNMTQFLQLPKAAHILDLPCGKGRHAVFLNSLGYQVTGVDLSENSIDYAKKFENKSLHFEVADMRKPLEGKYDAIFNLFTSFGYFEEDAEDLRILKNIKNGLNSNGVFVFDFLNVIHVKNTLIKKEIKTIEGIEFYIEREIKAGFILKKISFTADQKKHVYTERVKYLDAEKLKDSFKEVGFTITAIFGDYNLSDFDSANSNRLILVAK